MLFLQPLILNMTHFIIFFIFSYAAGSINFSILLFKLLRKEDPREKFSGNAGATNVYRQAGIYWAIVVLICDMSRAVGVSLLSMYFLPKDQVSLIGFGLIFGNRFPCFHGFKGGKGVANYLGFTAALTPMTAILSGCAWLSVYAVVRIPFISSFFMIFILAVGTLIAYNSSLLSGTGVCITSVFIFFNHRQNIMDMWNVKKST